LEKVDDGGEPTQAGGLPLWLRVPAKVGDTVFGLAAGAVEVLGFFGQMLLATWGAGAPSGASVSMRWFTRWNWSASTRWRSSG
jgi:hypothetical protein